jgi:hypothetical protein
VSDIHELVTEVLVSALPPNSGSELPFAVYVQWRGNDTYCVSRWSSRSQCWDVEANGWVYESIPSERADEFIAATRFPLDQAMQVARDIAPEVEVNGWTPATWLARWATS